MTYKAIAPVAWMRPSIDGYDSAFRDAEVVATSKASGATHWDKNGWVPLYVQPTIKEPLKVHASAEDYLRQRYGAYRGHFAWRELEEAYSQGRYDEAMLQGPSPWPECHHEWVHREQDQPWLVCEKCGIFLAHTGPRPGTVGLDE